MVPGFDIRTLTMVLLLLAIVHSIGLYTYSKSRSSFHGFTHICFGLLMLGLGFGIISFRGVISNWLTIVLSGSLVVYSITLIGIGVLRFFEFSSRFYQTLSYSLLALQIFSFGYLTEIAFDPQWRIAVICSIFSLQCGYLAMKLFQSKNVHQSQSVPLLASLYATFSFMFGARAVWSVTYYHESSALVKNVTHISSLITFLLMVVTTSLIIKWMANTRLQRNLERLATIDPLTEIYNRRALETMAQKQISLAKRENHPLALLLIDIDHFKQVNDDHGHQFGDEVLKKLCDVIQEKLRPYDIFARFGGEEFVLVMPNTKVADAIKRAEFIRHLIETTEFQPPKSESPRTITISIGVSQSSSDNIEWERLVSQADKGLYAAKTNGRNQVSFKAY